MSNFKINILGCGSATPTLKHLPSCQVVEHNSRYFMVDCGECAQLSLKKAGVKISRLNHIFISHLHGDHILGLPGLLSSLSLNDYNGEMHVYMMPEGIDIIKKTLDVFAHAPSYTLTFHPIKVGKHVIYEDETLTVSTFPLYHTVAAVGFLFQEKPKLRRIKGSMVEYYKVPLHKRAALKHGADFITDDGRVIANKFLTMDPDPSASYAYASDTMFSKGVIEAVKGVDLLYHEATYADDKLAQAKSRGHSTARQAGQVAQQAGVKKLMIGHFSKSYNSNESVLLNQAKEEFDNVIMAYEGLVESI